MARFLGFVLGDGVCLAMGSGSSLRFSRLSFIGAGMGWEMMRKEGRLEHDLTGGGGA